MPSTKYYNKRTGKWEYLNTRAIVIQSPGSTGTIDPSQLDLSDYYKKQESHDHFVEDVIYVGTTPPEEDNILWYDTSGTSINPGVSGGYVPFKGIFNYITDLPPDGNTAGQLCKVLETGSYYIYNGNEWDILGGSSGSVDPTLQAKVNSLESRVTELENKTPASADDFIPAVITDEEINNIVNSIMGD